MPPVTGVMSRLSRPSLLSLVILLSLAVLGVFAQTSTGELDVRVLDSSGAVGPAATVENLPTTGVVIAASTPNRILQFALRYSF